jgi:hypothetical protein
MIDHERHERCVRHCMSSRLLLVDLMGLFMVVRQASLAIDQIRLNTNKSARGSMALCIHRVQLVCTLHHYNIAPSRIHFPNNCVNLLCLSVPSHPSTPISSSPQVHHLYSPPAPSGIHPPKNSFSISSTTVESVI